MNTLSLLFILTSFYSIFNYNRLDTSAALRSYKNRVQVYLDLLFYFAEFFYYVWLIVNSIYNFEYTWILVVFSLLAWFFLKSKSKNNNFIYQLIRIIGLSLIYLEIKFF